VYVSSLRARFSDYVWRIGPPWLQRTMAVRILSAMMVPFDALADKTVDSIKARFPNATNDALPQIGRERRIRRGPAENAGTYSRRLLSWWDDHRGRGGPYALLRQLRAFWLDTYNVQIDVVSYNGLRHSIDTNGVITRDQITWTPDASGEWAQFWVFFHLTSDPGPLTPEQEANFLMIPIEWSAAHILREHVVLLWGFCPMWDFPPPVGDWDAWASGLTWDAWDAQAPYVLTHEET
jgi:hypothetical protein